MDFWKGSCEKRGAIDIGHGGDDGVDKGASSGAADVI